MKSSRIGLTSILLCCILLPSVSSAACPLGTANCLEVYDGSGGEVIGDDNFVTETSLDDITNNGATATVTSGVSAAVSIPAGSQGLVALAIDRYNDQTSNPTINGCQYLLNAAFQGNIRLGAEKTSDAGTETAAATIFSRATADVNNNLFGQATIDIATTSTGTGATYAIVDNAAAAYKAKRVCPTCPNVNNEIAGEVSARNVELRSCNAECTDFNCVNPAPTGTNSGSALITTSSNANDFSSTSTSNIILEVSATRGRIGSSTITGDINYASAASRARDGSAPLASGYNAQTIIRPKNIAVNAYAFAANDTDSSIARLGSEASHNQSDSTDRAYSKAEVYTAVKRIDMNSPLTLAKADAIASGVYLKANARDLRTALKYAFNCVTSADIQSYGQLKSVSDIWNRATSQLTATRTGNDAFASVSEDVSNYGPKSGSASDFSNVKARARSLRTESKSPKETRFVGMTARDTNCFIFGNTLNPKPVKNTRGPTFGGGIKKDTSSDTFFKQGSTRVWILSSQKIND